ncbi:MAG: HEAT repeat domain-containing protein [Gemmatales bacterium]|nr:HEAT repeat domain-containing protein [Gemmatales bacterium]MDW8386523.1 HEAT repeat domain-containing protein [Gemmatales bacterium]
MMSLLFFALLLPLLLGAAFLLGRYLRHRYSDGLELSPVTRQHLELYRGGQLPEAEIEAAKRCFREWLEHGEVERVESSLRAGTEFVVRVRALAEIGTEEACRILEKQLTRRLSNDQLEQAWYWIDLASSLRMLNRDESLPLLFGCVLATDEFPLVHYFAAETVCFSSFGSYVAEPQTLQGHLALQLLHRALEGLRFGVPPHVIVEGRLGDLIESLWDHRPDQVDPLVVRILVEVRRLLRRVPHLESTFADEAFEQEAFELQIARWRSLEELFTEYLHDAGPELAERLPAMQEEEQREALLALNDLRFDAAKALLPLLDNSRFAHQDLAVQVLRWSKDAAVAVTLRNWVHRRISQARRGMRRLRGWPPRKSSVPEGLPYQAILYALRGHPSVETEQFLLNASHDWDPTYRAAAVSSLGWWEPMARAEVLLHLQEARFDPSPEVRHAARAALARLGERQALQWFRQALLSDNKQRVLEAIQAVAVEEITLLWPDLDQLTESEDNDIAYCAREALELLREELDFAARR